MWYGDLRQSGVTARGPLYYTDSFKSAGQYVRDERKLTVEMACQISPTFADADPKGFRRDYDEASDICGWPTNMVGYWVECETLDKLMMGLDDGVARESMDDILEYLNER